MEKREKVIKCGWMVKSPPIESITSLFKDYKRRYFTFVQTNLNLDPDGEDIRLFLNYYEDCEAFLESKLPLGQINIDVCTFIESCHSMGKFDYVIALKTEGRLYYLCTSTDEERSEWLQTLRFYRFGNIADVASENCGKVKRRSMKGRLETFKAKRSNSRLIQDWPEDTANKLFPSQLSTIDDRKSVDSNQTTGGDSGVFSMDEGTYRKERSQSCPNFVHFTPCDVQGEIQENPGSANSSFENDSENIYQNMSFGKETKELTQEDAVSFKDGPTKHIQITLLISDV